MKHYPPPPPPSMPKPRRRIPAFHPVPVASRTDGWTARRQALFIGYLAQTRSVAKAARMVSMGRESVLPAAAARGRGGVRGGLGRGAGKAAHPRGLVIDESHRSGARLSLPERPDAYRNEQWEARRDQAETGQFRPSPVPRAARPGERQYKRGGVKVTNDKTATSGPRYARRLAVRCSPAFQPPAIVPYLRARTNKRGYAVMSSRCPRIRPGMAGAALTTIDLSSQE